VTACLAVLETRKVARMQAVLASPRGVVRLATSSLRGRVRSPSIRKMSTAASETARSARGAASVQAVGAVLLSGMVFYQAGRQNALERKIAEIENVMSVEQKALFVTGMATAKVHEHSLTQRMAEGMMGPGAKFGDILCVVLAFPMACAAVGAMSTKASHLAVAARSRAAQEAMQRPLQVAKEVASELAKQAARVEVPATKQVAAEVETTAQAGLVKARGVVAEFMESFAVAEAAATEAVVTEATVTVAKPIVRSSQFTFQPKQKQSSLMMRRKLSRGQDGGSASHIMGLAAVRRSM
jgi:hypothetical protein